MSITSKKKNPETPANQVFLTSSEFFSAPIKFSYLTNRRNSSNATRPSKKISSHSIGAGPAVGPGKYTIVSQSQSPSFHFSRSTRFGETECLSAFSRFKKTSIKEKEKINERIKKHKETEMLSKEKRAESVHMHAERTQFRSEVARLTRKNVRIVTLKMKTEKIQEKIRRFNLRTRLKEIAEIKKFWILFALFTSIPTCIKYQILHKKRLRAASIRLLRIFQFICKFLGKIHRIHIKLKTIKSLRILRIYFTKYIRLWIKQKTIRYRKLVANSLEAKLGCLSLRAVVTTWSKHYETIKRIFRLALFYKISLYQTLMHRWNKCEWEIQGEAPPMTRRVRKALSIQNMKDTGNEGCFQIPVEIKIVYLRRFIHQRVMDYIKEFKIFKTHFWSAHRQNMKNRWLLENFVEIEYPIPPPKVNVFEEFDLKVVKEIVLKAVQEKAQWKEILFSDQGRIGRIFQKRMSGLI